MYCSSLLKTGKITCIISNIVALFVFKASSIYCSEKCRLSSAFVLLWCLAWRTRTPQSSSRDCCRSWRLFFFLYYLGWLVATRQHIRYPSVCHRTSMRAAVAFIDAEVLSFKTAFERGLFAIFAVSHAARVTLVDERTCIQEPASAVLDNHGHLRC